MTLEEVDKCIEYLNNEVSGLSIRTGDTGNPWKDTVKRWFPSELTWYEWLVKFEADMNIAGADCYKMRVITNSFVEGGYPFAIHFITPIRVDTFIAFKGHLLNALKIYARARQQQAARLQRWKEEQIKKAAEGFEA